jgi:MoxR-like ATPase
MKGRYHVTYEDIQNLTAPILRHRILLNFQAESDKLTTDTILSRLLEHVPVPKE